MKNKPSQKPPETVHMMSHRASEVSNGVGVVEKLSIPPARDGDVWLHHGTGQTPFHRHEELEINICVTGSAAYVVDNQRFALSRRTALWLFPAQNHLLVDRSPDFAMWIGVWRPGMLEHLCRGRETAPLRAQLPDSTWIARLGTEDMARLETLLEALSGAADDDRLNAGLGWLLMECFAAWKRSGQPVAGHAVHPAIERAARLLRDENLEVPELARRVGLSPSRLSRVFHQQIGQTLTEYRLQTTTERFLNNYDGRNYSLTEAAAIAGFGSYAQFHRALLARTGCNPSQHRARMRAL
jgi:AraC-like DNA-binding protein